MVRNRMRVGRGWGWGWGWWGCWCWWCWCWWLLWWWCLIVMVTVMMTVMAWENSAYWPWDLRCQTFFPWSYALNVLILMFGFWGTRSSAQEILGATIVGPGAGDHISEAVRKGMPIGCSMTVEKNMRFNLVCQYGLQKNLPFWSMLIILYDFTIFHWKIRLAMPCPIIGTR